MGPLYWIISVVLIGWHELWSLVLKPTSGASWALSIVGLTVVIRAALIPLFVRQIKASRNMQLIQPKVKALQEKYGHDRELLAQKTMELYKDSGTNPFASCLPIILQMPIFFALFRLLNHAAHDEARGILTPQQVDSLSNADIFGAKISDTFTNAESVNVQILAGFLVIAMTATTFLTQRQLMAKNMPADAMSGPYARQQKMLLYVLPLVFAVGGIAFPIGVLLYWTTSNLWTMGQQFYVIRNNPAPGTPAFTAKLERDAHKRARKGLPETPEPEQPGGTVTDPEPPRPQQRQQPKRQSRQQRKKQKPGAGDNRADGTDDGAGDGAAPASG
ncbi:membrane protein insertase YidC [Nocardioides sp.]|uniref:membrane protein insertase YidC n=1 Tax=Nocardioides sp. TaxID=35761 RepID=UPI0035290120